MNPIIYYAIPGFVVLLLLESLFDHGLNRKLNKTPDTFASLSMGVGNLIIMTEILNGKI